MLRSPNDDSVISLDSDIDDALKRILKAKTFNVRFAGTDGKRRLLTFSVDGLADQIDFSK